MRKFKIKNGTDVYRLFGHTAGEVYELDQIDSSGDIWLKTDNKYRSWCYSPDEVEEVFEEPNKPLHKDTDLGYFAGLAMQVMLANTNVYEKENGCKNSIEWAKELIKQLDEQSK